MVRHGPWAFPLWNVLFLGSLETKGPWFKGIAATRWRNLQTRENLPQNRVRESVVKITVTPEGKWVIFCDME